MEMLEDALVSRSLYHEAMVGGGLGALGGAGFVIFVVVCFGVGE